MARDLLDADLLTVVEELERAAATVRALPEAWPWLERCGVRPAELACELDAAARKGREAVTAKANADYGWREAEAAGVEVAEATLALQSRARTTLSGLLAIDREHVQDDVTALRGQLALRRARLQAALDQTRRVRDALERPGQSVVAHPAGRDLLERFRALLMDLTAAFAARDVAVRERLAANRAFYATRRDLVRLLRRVRVLWSSARTWSDDTIPELTFDLAEAELAAVRARRAARTAEVEADADA